MKLRVLVRDKKDGEVFFLERGNYTVEKLRETIRDNGFELIGDIETTKGGYEMNYKFAMTGPGTCRGYRIDESGLYTVVDINFFDGMPVTGHGVPYPLDGATVALKGWPDKAALLVNDRLALGLVEVD